MQDDRIALRSGSTRLLAAAAISLLALLAVPPAMAAAQVEPPGDEPAQLLDRLRRDTGAGLQVAPHPGTGRVRYLTTAPGRPVPPAGGTERATNSEAAALSFIDSYGPVFGVDGRHELRLTADEQGAGDRTNLRYQQLHRGVPVFAGELVIGVDSAGGVLSVNGEAADLGAVDTDPSLDAATARQRAAQASAKVHGVDESTVRAGEASLWVYDARLLSGAGPGRARLVWRTEVRPVAGDAFRELVLVDADLGSVALHFDQIAGAKHRFVCDRANVPGAPEECTSNFTRAEGQGPVGVGEVNLAYDYSGHTYDFYASKFGRDSVDNAGLPLRSTVRYCPSPFECPYTSAFWNGRQAVFGVGSAQADDIVGHEFTHGVTRFESNLLYYFQSGAINESLSDVFGEFIDLGNGRGNDVGGSRWLLGEDVRPFRSLKDPPAHDDPDRVGSPLYHTGADDNGGVHTNSGINNKAAFLLTDGGTFNGRTVTGLGIDKVARIYYEAQTHLLTSGSEYADLYNILQQACRNLTGFHGITSANCAEVKDAVDATEMNRQPAGASTVEAPLCPAGQVPLNQFFDDLERPSSGNWLTTRPSSRGGWIYPLRPGVDEVYTTSGTQALFGLAPDATSVSSAERTGDVTPPVGHTTYLRFNHALDLEQDFDGGRVETSVDGGATWTDAGPLFRDASGYNGLARSFSGRAFTGQSKGYQASRLDLSSFAGRPVRFRFRIATDVSIPGLGWVVDDVRVYRCVAGGSGPTADAGADLIVDHNTPFILNGSGVDPDGRPLAYRWVQLSGVSATIRDRFARATGVDGVNGGANGQDLVFRLTVTDAQGLTATDSVNVHINPK